MHVCPQCQFASIPAWRAFVVISVLETPFTCSHCGAQLKLRRSALDSLVTLPIAATSMFAMQFEGLPIGFVMWSLFLATVAAIALWANFIRYKVVEEPLKFKPHPSSPPRC